MVTPNRAEATCLMALRRQSPLASRWKRASSSPPSPVLDLPPMRFMAMASVSCASLLMEPNDMAPVAKRFTISLAGSTSSIGTGFSASLNSIRPRSVQSSLALVVDQLRVFLEGLEALLPDGVLQLADGQRIEQMILAAHAVLIAAADLQLGIGFRQRLESVVVLHLGFARQHIQADAFDARRGAGEISLDQRFVQADGFEHLRAAIALQRGDAHLREDLQQSFVDGLLVILQRRFKGDAGGQIARARPDLPASRWPDTDSRRSRHSRSAGRNASPRAARRIR